MMPLKLYPHNFSDLLNSEQGILSGYRDLLKRSNQQNLKGLFKVAEQMILVEEAPEELERIRVGLLQLRVELKTVWENEYPKIFLLFQKNIPEQWQEFSEKKATSDLEQLIAALEIKLNEVGQKGSREMEQLKTVYRTHFPLAEVSARTRKLLEDDFFIKKAEDFIIEFAFQGRGNVERQLELLIGEIDSLRNIAGPLIGKKWAENSPYYLGEEEELDFIEAVIAAGKSFLPSFILQLHKILQDDTEAGVGKGAFYLLNLSGAIQKIAGITLPLGN